MAIDIEILDDPARACAAMLVGVAAGGGEIVLTGGSTPRAAYVEFVDAVRSVGIDVSRSAMWFSDERCVPPDDERSNYGMARKALLDRLDGAPAAIHRMEGELGRGDGAAEYKLELADVGAFDLVLLGLGPDGHIASLFPNFPTLDVTGRDVVGSEAGHEPFVDRISMTLPRLCNTRELLFLVAGEDKADAVARALAGEPSHQTPGSLARAAEGATSAIVDRAAAAQL